MEGARHLSYSPYPRTNMRTKTLLSAAAGLLAASGTGAAQIDFQPALSVFVGAQPDGVAVGDFNGDGLPDLAATANNPDRVVFLAGDGAGGFSPLGSFPTGGGTSPHRPVAADLDGDGDDDVAVTLQNVNQVRIILNTGGGFAGGPSLAVGAEPRDIAAGDFEPDGDVDLAVASRDGNSVSFLRNGGAGGFTVQTVGTGQEPRELALGDFDGDGDLDAAVSAHDDRRVDVLSNQGASFALTQSIPFFNPFRPDGLTAADLDGDGDVDLAATSGDDAILGQNVAAVLVNNGGAFAGPNNFPTGGFDSSSITSGDLDGDGDADLLVVNESSATVSALAGNGNATFGAPALFSVGVEPTHAVLADLDGSGSLDAVTANTGSNNASVLLGEGGGPPAGPTLTLVAPAAVGAQGQLLVDSPGDAGKAYLCGFSGGTSPGIVLSDGSVVPLVPDGIFTLSTNPFNGTFVNTFGVLNPAGEATVLINVPDSPAFIGFSVFAAFVVFEPGSPTGIGTISAALEVTVVP